MLQILDSEAGETSAEEEPPGYKPAGEAQNKVEFDAMSLQDLQTDRDEESRNAGTGCGSSFAVCELSATRNKKGLGDLVDHRA